ncbi:MAG: peptidylprolyl isomerase [Flavobacteriaceae bacterium]
MAVLSKIRQRSILVIVVVGISLLAFVIGDAIQGGVLGDSMRYAGSINGEDISSEEFRLRVSNQEQQGQGSSTTMISNSLWNQEIRRVLYAEQIEKAGIRSGKKQIEGIFEQNPQVNAMFLDELGRFSQEKYNQYIEMVKAQNPTQWKMWLESYEQQLMDFANEQTYNTLVKAGINASNVEGKALYKRENDKVSFDYVMLPYTYVNDDEVSVSDAEIIDYMSKRKSQYKADDSRDIEFFLIESKASEKDIEEISQNVAALLEAKTVFNEEKGENESVDGFATTSDVKEFVTSNSDIPFNEKYVFAKEVPAITDFTVGSTTQVYRDGDYVKVSRILDSKTIADSVKASHIIIPYAGAFQSAATTSKEDAKKQIDSIYNLVKANEAKFKEVADQINSDGTKGRGGDIGWVQYSQISYEGFDQDFAEFMFFNPKGSSQVVETKFGYHIIKVDDTGSKQPAYQIATIARKIEPSNTTNDEVYTHSQKVELEAQTKSFEDLAKENNLEIIKANGVTAQDENLQGLGSQRNIIVWAFGSDAQKGSVRRFDITQGHVIAKIKNINDNGLQSVERIRASVEPIIKNQKKAAILKEKAKGATLEEIATANSETVRSATGITLANPNLPGVGLEPKVTGRAFSSEVGKVSEAIEGKMGIFFVKTQSVVAAPELPNYVSFTNRVKQQTQGMAQSRVFAALRNKAEINDNRINIGL